MQPIIPFTILNQNFHEIDLIRDAMKNRKLTKERFELEFNLEKGTSFNTFFIRSDEELFIIHPPEKQFLNLFNKVISSFNLRLISRGEMSY